MNVNYMQDIFSFKKTKKDNCETSGQTTNDNVDEDDLYAILGCHPEATIDQINAEYRVRVRELHPDKCTFSEPIEKCSIDSKFCKLQRAKEILGDEKRRRDYDRWRQSGLHFSYRKWCQLNESGGLHNSIHWFGNGRQCKPALMPSQATKDDCTNSTATSHSANTEHVNWNSPAVCSTDTACLSETFTTHWKEEKETSLLQQFRNYEI